MIHVCIMGWYYDTRMYHGVVLIHVCIMGVL